MMRFCAIGNSHLAALILGWKQIQAEYPEIDFAFFGAPGRMMADLVVSGNSLTTTNAELSRYLEFASSSQAISAHYDGFLVCGLEFRLARIRPLFGRYRVETHTEDDRILISDECYLRSAQGCLRNSLAASTVSKLRQMSAAPIKLIPQPMPGEKYTAAWLSRLKRNREEKSVADYFDLAALRVARERDAQVVLQPAHTKSSPLQTKIDYSRGAIRLQGGLSVPHDEAEPFHMNADYGSAVLREALGSFGTH